MIIRGIFEVKHGTDIPAKALRQGASEHQMLPVCMLNRGWMVPVVGRNGHLMQFGAVNNVELLDPTVHLL